jgi:hypothetical protein
MTCLPMAALLPLLAAEPMKTTTALAREHLAPWPLAGAGWLWASVMCGELFAAVALLASDSVPAVLVRSLRLFLRF